MKIIINIFLNILIITGIFNTVWAAQKNSEDSDISFLPPTFDEEKLKDVPNTNLVESDKYNDLQVSLANIFQYKHQSNVPDWKNLSRLSLQNNAELQNGFSLKTNFLFNTYMRETDEFKVSDDFRLDIKEAYLSWQQSPTMFFDVGRVNIKSGVASGFNPTDYFKVGTLLDRNTEDISQLRDARIGSLLLRTQKLWSGGSLTLVVSPKVSKKINHWTTDKDIVGLNLHKSNDRSRVMLKWNQKISEGLNPELIYYNESGKHNLGINISQSINNQWIAYGEWNIGKRRDLVDEAILEQRQNHQLLPNVADKFSNDSGEKYLQQLAIGVSFTSNSNITTKIEYHYNQAGLSSVEAHNWFNALGNSENMVSLLSIRGLAQTRNEPLGQNSIFLRSNWNDAVVDKLDLTGLLITDLNDSSHLIQLEAEYELTPKSSISLKLAEFQGKAKSIYGSLDNGVSSTLQYVFHF